jgi:ribosomal protein S18 acetylase RimI-like enzyme
MPVTVTPVRGAADLNAFLRVPYAVHGQDHPQYVYPLLGHQKQFLDRAKNPFFRHAEAEYWVARNDAGQLVGRIAASVDALSNEYHHEQVGYFGFYECLPDDATANALLATARAWIAGRGMTTVRGPGCFTTNHDYLGLLVKGHDARPVIGMPWQPPYYQAQLEAFGLAKAVDLWAWDVDRSTTGIPERVARFAERIRDRKTFTIRRFRLKEFWQDVEIVREIYQEAWKDNWGFVPMDEVEFRYAAKDMKSMVDPGFLLIAEQDGQPIGFCMTTQDFHQAMYPLKGRLLPFGWLRFLWEKRRIHGCRTLLLGVKPEHRARGVETLLIYEGMRYGIANGFPRGQSSWVLEGNVAMNRILESYGATVNTIYRIYEMPAR